MMRPALRTYDGSLDKLIHEARYLRDHLLRLEGHDSLPLARALLPFDNLNDDEKASDDDINGLREAFQTAYDLTLQRVDSRTLDYILAGQSPHTHRDSMVASVGLVLIGIMLVIGAFHYTYWSNRASLVSDQAEQFIAFDHFGQMMKVVELQNYFSKIDGDLSGGDVSANPDLEPQLVYLEELAALKAQYHHEATLPARMYELRESFNPVGIVVDRMQRRFCRPDRAEDLPLISAVLSCPNFTPASGQPSRQLTAGTVPNVSANNAGNIQVTQAATAPPSYPSFVLGLGEVDRLEQETMKAAGRRLLNEYAASQRVVEGLQQEMREKLNIVHFWALPILYGALGSIVYCMWRVLNPNVSGLGFIHPVMRTFFAGLAALTFSMLLVPSNILTVGVDMNRPLIYLLSFVFGYSIEAFVNTLNVLNNYVATNIAVRGKKAQ